MDIPLIAGVGIERVNFYSFNCKDGFKLIHSYPFNVAKPICVTDDGKRLGFYGGGRLVVMNSDDFSIPLELQETDLFGFTLSPCGNVVVTFKLFHTDRENLDGFPNLRFIDVNSMQTLEIVKHRQCSCWQPQWTSDSSLCARNNDGEIHVYINNKFDEPPTNRLKVSGMTKFSLTKSTVNKHLAVYIPQRKDGLSSVKIYQWRNGEFIHLSTKSFNLIGSVDLLWNDNGTYLLILTTATKNQNRLYFMNTVRAGENLIVNMPCPGPIHQVVWKPTGYLPSSGVVHGAQGSRKAKRNSQDLFAVSYGNDPASVALFGIQCEPLFDIKTGAPKLILFNPRGTLALMREASSSANPMYVWDIKNQQKCPKFPAFVVKDAYWTSDGEHLLLATNTPESDIDQRLSVWHYDATYVKLGGIHDADLHNDIQQSFSKVVILPIEKSISVDVANPSAGHRN